MRYERGEGVEVGGYEVVVVGGCDGEGVVERGEDEESAVLGVCERKFCYFDVG